MNLTVGRWCSASSWAGPLRYVLSDEHRTRRPERLLDHVTVWLVVIGWVVVTTTAAPMCTPGWPRPVQPAPDLCRPASFGHIDGADFAPTPRSRPVTAPIGTKRPASGQVDINPLADQSRCADQRQRHRSKLSRERLGVAPVHRPREPPRCGRQRAARRRHRYPGSPGRRPVGTVGSRRRPSSGLAFRRPPTGQAECPATLVAHEAASWGTAWSRRTAPGSRRPKRWIRN